MIAEEKDRKGRNNRTTVLLDVVLLEETIEREYWDDWPTEEKEIRYDVDRLDSS